MLPSPVPRWMVRIPTAGFRSRSSRSPRSEEHTSELQSQSNLVCRLLLEKKKTFSMALLAACVAFAPVSGVFVLAISTYFAMGSARAVGGVAMNTNLMEMVPKHLMRRVQHAFYFCGPFLQLVLAVSVGAVAHRVSL